MLFARYVSNFNYKGGWVIPIILIGGSRVCGNIFQLDEGAFSMIEIDLCDLL